jgi:hypothetical protein
MAIHPPRLYFKINRLNIEKIGKSHEFAAAVKLELAYTVGRMQLSTAVTNFLFTY